MADFSIGFKWPRSSRYEFQAFPDDSSTLLPGLQLPRAFGGFGDERYLGQFVAVGKPTSRRLDINELTSSINLLVGIARDTEAASNLPPRYRVRERKDFSDDADDADRIIGDDPNSPSPFLFNTELIAAAAPRLQKVVPTIAKNLGLLTSTSGPREPELLSQWYALAYELKQIFDEGIGGGHYGVYLVRGATGSNLVIEPPDLWSAMIIHAMQMVSKGAKISNCEQCGTPFLSGGGRGGSKRGGGTRFCSDRCRWDFNNEKRKA